MAPVSSSSPREYDIILFGASGYTGKLCAEHITNSLPTSIRWALSGRSQSKLEAVKADLHELNSTRDSPGIEIAQLSKEDLDALAKKTRLLINTVGPYCRYGENVVEACANNGTHYLDVTGEAVWVYDMIQKYHERAKATGAIIIPQIGIESAPADLGTFALVSFIREKLSKPTEDVIFTVQNVKGAPSGGTLDTILSLPDVYSFSKMANANKSWAFSPVPRQSSGKPAPGLFGIRHIPKLGTLGYTIQASADRAIVQRSWGLIGQGQFYGKSFTFHEYFRYRSFLVALIVKFAFMLGLMAVAIAPLRPIIKNFIFAPGEGTAKEVYEKDLFDYAAIGVPEGESKQRAFLDLKYRGGNYLWTGIFLAQAAVTILQDDTLAKKLGGGILTPATLGQPYIERLQSVGLEIELSLYEETEAEKERSAL